MEDKDKIIAELKAEIETLKKVKDFACINLNNYIADNNKLKAENARLKSCLQEIKEIAEKECKDCLNKRSDSCWICPYYPILDLITKAESEEE